MKTTEIIKKVKKENKEARKCNVTLYGEVLKKMGFSTMQPTKVFLNALKDGILPSMDSVRRMK